LTNLIAKVAKFLKEVKEVLVFLQGSYNDCFAVVVATIYELADIFWLNVEIIRKK
jgi:hypothetical protein